MASVAKRGNKYTVRYSYENERGEKVPGWESFSSEQEATDRKHQIELEQKRGDFLAPNTMTVKELFDRWLPIQNTKHRWAPKTYLSNLGQVQDLICPYIGAMQVQKVRAYHIEELYQTLAKTPRGQYIHGVKQTLTPKQQERLLSGTTLNEVHGLLRTAFAYAVEWDIIRKSPIPRDAPRKSTNEREIWSDEEMAAALDDIEDPLLHLAVHMTIVGSLRQGELLGIMPQDLDFEGANGRGTISINKSLQRTTKAALKECDSSCVTYRFPERREYSESCLILKTTKNKKSTRVLFMTEPLKKELKSWLEKLARDEELCGDKYQNSGMLFRMPDGFPVEPTRLRRWFEQWQAAHPQHRKILFHALRHSSATYQLKVSGGDIKSVQGNTGHAQANVLVNTYAHIQDRSRLELSHKFEEDFYRHSPNPDTDKAEMDSSEVSCDLLLQAIRNATPEQKKQLTLALLA